MLQAREDGVAAQNLLYWGVSASAGIRHISIDSNGNLTQKIEGSDTWTYEWNAENQLKRVLKNSVEQARFAYDPQGRRVEKVAGGVTTTYTYDGDAILREIAGSSTLKYVHGPGIDEPVAHEDGAGVLTYLHVDGLGSVLRTTNSAGAVTASRRYDVFGNFELGATNGYAFTGREWDSEIGLYYYRARFYDPKVGIFISEDPVDFRDGLTRYAYVLSNPPNLIDPEGLAPSGLSCGPTCGPEITNAAQQVCNEASKVRIAWIRRCLQAKCRSGAVQVQCSGTENPACNLVSPSGNKSPAFTPAANQVLICQSNAPPAWSCWKRVIIHELALHACQPPPPRPKPGTAAFAGQRLDHALSSGFIQQQIPCP